MSSAHVEHALVSWPACSASWCEEDVDVPEDDADLEALLPGDATVELGDTAFGAAGMALGSAGEDEAYLADELGRWTSGGGVFLASAGDGTRVGADSATTASAGVAAASATAAPPRRQLRAKATSDPRREQVSS